MGSEGTLFFPFLMEEMKNGGYTVFSLLNKEEAKGVRGTLFSPFLVKEKKGGCPFCPPKVRRGGVKLEIVEDTLYCF